MDPLIPEPLSECVLERIRYFRRTKRVLEATVENPDKVFPLKEAAEIAGMESSAFSRFFRRKIGITYTKFQRAHRVSVAIKLMLEKDLAVKEVADAVGYSSISTFTRNFKKETGRTPSDFQSAINGGHYPREVGN